MSDTKAKVYKKPILLTGPYYISPTFSKADVKPTKGTPAILNKHKLIKYQNNSEICSTLFKYQEEFRCITKIKLNPELKPSTMVAIARIRSKKMLDYKLLHNLLKDKLPYKLHNFMVINVKEGGFAGQSTIVIKKVNYKRSVNCKIFGNGSIQLSGIDVPSTGISTINNILKILKHLKIVENSAIISDYETTNINCKYVNKYEINQHNLFNLLKKMGCLVLFDLSHYPGINFKYFSNIHNNNKNGICQCSSPCVTKKGHGYTKGSCRRITISIFRSGVLLITGARTYFQLNEVYEFIIQLFKENESIIKLPKFELLPTNDDDDILF